MPINYKDLKETLTIPERIGHNQFGISEEIFNRSVKGQRLPIVYSTGKFTYVEVEGEVYSIHEDDLVPDRKKVNG